jgi:hypothetical protein
MANLTENPATWETGIYQIEETDPVLGGVPNAATGAGMSNIPHKQLTDRTAWLKRVIDESGLGALAVPLVTLNSAAARITGSYRFASSDPNTPASGVAGTVQVIAASANAVNQTALDSASTRVWTRFWNGTVWSAWREVVVLGATSGLIARASDGSPVARSIAAGTGIVVTNGNGASGSPTVAVDLTTAFGSSLASNGWQRLPSGLILQWGGIAINTNPRDVTLPISFPNAHLQAFATESGAGLLLFGASPQTLSTVRIWTNNTSTAIARFSCIGF